MPPSMLKIEPGKQGNRVSLNANDCDHTWLGLYEPVQATAPKRI